MLFRKPVYPMAEAPSTAGRLAGVQDQYERMNAAETAAENWASSAAPMSDMAAGYAMGAPMLDRRAAQSQTLQARQFRQDEDAAARAWAKQAADEWSTNASLAQNYEKMYLDDQNRAEDRAAAQNQRGADNELAWDRNDAQWARIGQTDEQAQAQWDRKDQENEDAQKQKDWENQMRVAEFDQRNARETGQDAYTANKEAANERKRVSDAVMKNHEAWASAATQTGVLPESAFWDKGASGNIAKPALGAWGLQLSQMAGDPHWDSLDDGERARIAAYRAGIALSQPTTVVAPAGPGGIPPEVPAPKQNPYAGIAFPKDAPLQFQAAWDRLQQNPDAEGATSAAQALQAQTWKRAAPDTGSGGSAPAPAKAPAPPPWERPQEPAAEAAPMSGKAAFDAAQGGGNAGAFARLDAWQRGQAAPGYVSSGFDRNGVEVFQKPDQQYVYDGGRWIEVY